MPNVTITTADQPTILAAAAAATGSQGFAPDAEGLTIADERGPIVHAVFERRAGENVDLHLGCRDGRGLTRAAIVVLMRVAFDPRYVGARTVWCPIAASNVPAQIAALKMGFQFEARRRGYAAGGEDAILMALRLDDMIPAATSDIALQEAAPPDQQEA